MYHCRCVSLRSLAHRRCPRTNTTRAVPLSNLLIFLHTSQYWLIKEGEAILSSHIPQLVFRFLHEKRQVERDRCRARPDGSFSHSPAVSDINSEDAASTHVPLQTHDLGNVFLLLPLPVCLFSNPFSICISLLAPLPHLTYSCSLNSSHLNALRQLSGPHRLTS